MTTAGERDFTEVVQPTQKKRKGKSQQCRGISIQTLQYTVDPE